MRILVRNLDKANWIGQKKTLWRGICLILLTF
jgi:hypothetical protein